ncbi:hypothetical protein HXX76_012472 [Chlamydomonas incerta]|uniref:Uncharacterized protein n=1 Tax=Chlamydomonas incerta TaxID=51695 RepID=A0A835SKL3_CHLIN|nr:hypothetical protein HXX76_012472 [Chlamydomonas incerta]|eukprot:KAG2427276.1 hypothetical protein HXX76_012472 [Chlamydomonas incerta]
MATSLFHSSSLLAPRNACQANRRSVRAHVAAVQHVADVAAIKVSMSVDTAKLEALAEEAFRKAKEVGKSARMIADEALYRRAVDTEAAEEPQLPLPYMEERTSFAAAAATARAAEQYEQANAGVLSQLEAQAMEAARCAMASHAAAAEAAEEKARLAAIEADIAAAAVSGAEAVAAPRAVVMAARIDGSATPSRSAPASPKPSPLSSIDHHSLGRPDAGLLAALEAEALRKARCAMDATAAAAAAAAAQQPRQS